MLKVVEAVQLTDTGRQREANEDSYFARSPLFAVADGMGGAQAGEVASKVAVEAFEAVDESELPPEELLRRTAQLANKRIFDLAQGDSSRSGMGTTLTAALVHGDEISFGHVGDSRAYVWRDRKLKQITNDHSLVEELRRQGRLTRDQAAEHPQRSVITRALGPEPKVQVDTMTFRARPGDVILLCSDGLTTMLADEDVAAILAREGDLQRTARRLIRAANDRGGRDNITVVLFRLESSDVAAGAGDEGATLIGASAEEGGLTADAVRAAAAERTSSTGSRRPGAVRPAPPPPRRRGRSVLKGLAGLLVLAAVIAAGIFGIRQIWFLGVDDQGKVGLYHGLPYELPFGIELYSEVTPSTISLEQLPEERRGVAVDHDLRSRSDAESLIDDLEQAAAAAATGEAVSGSGGNATGSSNTPPQTIDPGGGSG
jgi:serine/threonine protein phosphatase PrpC